MSALGILINQDRTCLRAVRTSDLIADLVKALDQNNPAIQVASATLLADVVSLFRDDAPASMLQEAGITNKEAELAWVGKGYCLGVLRQQLTSQFLEVKSAVKSLCTVLAACSPVSEQIRPLHKDFQRVVSTPFHQVRYVKDNNRPKRTVLPGVWSLCLQGVAGMVWTCVFVGLSLLGTKIGLYPCLSRGVIILLHMARFPILSISNL